MSSRNFLFDINTSNGREVNDVVANEEDWYFYFGERLQKCLMWEVRKNIYDNLYELF